MLSEATGRTTPLGILGEVRALEILRRGILILMDNGLQVIDVKPEWPVAEKFQSSF